MSVNIKSLRESAEISFTELAVHLKKYLESVSVESLIENDLAEKEHLNEIFGLLRQKQTENLEDEWTKFVLNKVEESGNQTDVELQAALNLFETSSSKLQSFPLKEDQSEEIKIETLGIVINHRINFIEKLIETIVNTLCSENSFIIKIMRSSDPPLKKYQTLTDIAFVVNPEAKTIDEKIRLTTFLQGLISLRKLRVSIKENEETHSALRNLKNQKYRLNIVGAKSHEDQLKDLQELSSKLSARNLSREYNRTISKINDSVRIVINHIRVEAQKSSVEKNKESLTKELEQGRLQWRLETRQERNKIISELQKQKAAIFGQTTRIEILPFEIFPKGKLTVDDLIKILRSRGISVGTSGKLRLNKIEEHFDYEVKCIGKGDFNGYIIYRFKDNDIVIAEKPAYGNATYLVKGEWKTALEILQLSRGDARQSYPQQVKRVIHYDETQWLIELKYKFNNWF